MNWKKAKTILIITLVLTNVFLLVIYFNGLDIGKNKINEDLLDLLSTKGIYFENKGYNFPQYLKKVYVDYYEYENDVIVNKILGNNYMKSNNTYLNKDYYLEINENNVLKYSKRGISLEDNKTSLEEATIISNDFLKKVGFMDDSVKLISKNKNKDYIVLNYKKRINDKFIEKSYMKVEVFNGKIILLERKWLNHETSENDKNKIISLERALYKLENKIKQKKNVSIENIQLGYILESDIVMQNIQSGEAFPYFKFYLSNGETIYIEAIEN